MHTAMERTTRTTDIVRLLILNGGDIHSKNLGGKTPLCFVEAPDLKADMVFLTRRPLLFLLEAICIAEDLQSSLRRLAENTDLMRYIVKFV